MAFTQSLYYMFLLLQLVPLLAVHGIFINSTEQLNEVFKGINNMAASEIDVELDNRVEYGIPGGMVYTVRNKTFTIKSVGDDEAICATITCQGEPNQTSGLVFIRSIVSINNLRFTQCGGSTLHNHVIGTIMSISPAALTFINTQVHMTSTNIDMSHGFAIYGYNLIESKFEIVHVENTYHMRQKLPHDVKDTGNGVLIHFDDRHTNKDKASVILSKCVFNNNTNIYNGKGSRCIQQEFVKGHDKVRQYFAAGLTILYTQVLYMAEVSINGGIFSQNSGVYAGAILIVNLKDTRAITIVKGAVFLRNALSSCHGADLQFFHLGGNTTETNTPTLALEDLIFMGGNSGIKHTAPLGSVTVELYMPRRKTYFLVRNVTFASQNTIQIEGVCLQMILYRNSNQETVTVKAILYNITAVDNHAAFRRNTPKSLFFFENIKKVWLTGRGFFRHNLGSVIHVKEGELHMTGVMEFIDNEADNGAAILGHANVQVFLKRGLKASFINNTAYYSGGAIYVRSNSYNNCAIQMRGLNRELYFSGNKAKTAGNDLFISPISKCKKKGTYSSSWLENYTNYFNFSQDNSRQSNGLLDLSTTPYKIVIKFTNYKVKTITTYPGKLVKLAIAAKDYDNRNVFSFVSIQVFTKWEEPSYMTGKVWLQQSKGDRALEQASRTLIDLSVHTNHSGIVKGHMVFSIPSLFSRSYYLTIIPCPIGFSVDKHTGSCVCSNLIATISGTQCDINTRRINTSSENQIWIGTLTNGNNTMLGMSYTCPLVYCHRVKHTDIKLSEVKGETTLTHGNTTKPLCKGNRVGPLCGQCNHSANLSIVFGSYECSKCSNLWLLTIVIYIIWGPLQLYFIYRLSLTITTGTINGAVFYIQASNIGIMEYLLQTRVKYPITRATNKVLYSVLALLNSNLPFKLCFYDGMDQLMKTGLGLIYPVYGVAIVLVIIVVSRYSMWVSNRTAHLSVQVLITSIHLSFSKLLLSLLEVFTAAKIETGTNSMHVWYWDGSVEYMGHAHYPLVVVTVVTVSILLIPYITILIIGRPLMRVSKRVNTYFRPVLEAVHGPYRTRKHHWFVLRLILLILQSSNYVVLRTSSTPGLIVVSSILMLLFTVLQAYARPFKTSYINAIDLWLMVNYTVTHGLIWLKQTFLTRLAITLLIVSALVTFGMILLYHVALATNQLKRIKDKLNIVSSWLKRNPVIRFMMDVEMTSNMATLDLRNTDSYYGSCDQYREPLLGID